MMKWKKFLLTMISFLIITGCTFGGYFPDAISRIEEGAEEPKLTTSTIMKSSNTEFVNFIGDEAQEKEGGQEFTNLNNEEDPASSSSINPLTGLPVDNPENLLLPPALVSVTNFPTTARPQAGLSTSSIVFELSIGDGMTRYLAVFYGDYPKLSVQTKSGDMQKSLTEGMQEPVIGPIRSGRLPYDYVRQLFNGFIVMASAYSKVADQLSNYVNVVGNDQSDINSAMITVGDIEKIAKESEKKIGEDALSGMVFEKVIPEGGKNAPSLWIFYAYKNQVFWRYNEDDGSYHRWQDDADGSTFIEQTDRLNGDPLTYE
ncbi:MAG: DUF3048 domain-containing protein, partial [Bacteroidales bacterium]|nr:DUF3048 domain-containing protein [Bacteroidales bacterium]